MLVLDLLPVEHPTVIRLPRHAPVSVDPVKADDVVFGNFAAGRQDAIPAREAVRPGNPGTAETIGTETLPQADVAGAGKEPPDLQPAYPAPETAQGMPSSLNSGSGLARPVASDSLGHAPDLPSPSPPARPGPGDEVIKGEERHSAPARAVANSTERPSEPPSEPPREPPDPSPDPPAGPPEPPAEPPDPSDPVDPVSDAPELQVAPASGAEDTAIPLSIQAALSDPSEVLSVTISGVPDGAVLSAGTDNGDGTWTLTPEQLPGLTVTPPAHADADFTLTVTASSTDGTALPASTSVQLVVSVAAVADAPNVDANNVQAVLLRPEILGGPDAETISGTGGAEVIRGGEGDDILIGNGGSGLATGAFEIAASLIDTDGSESLSVVVSGVPGGVMLSAGTDNGDGTWTMSPSDLPGLTLSAPSGIASFPLTITAIARESAGGGTSTRSTSVMVEIDPGGDILDGGGGDDTIVGGAGGDTLLGGTGIDTALYGSSGSGVRVDLTTGSGSGGDAAGDVLSGIENVTGSLFADLLIGDANANVLVGGAGNDSLEGLASDDTLLGGTGHDLISGGEGNDLLEGGTGADTLDGGSGTDTARYDASSSGVTVNLTSGTGLGGDAAGDVLRGIEHVVGSSWADWLTGDGHANSLEGGAGADTLDGGSGSDTLDGSSGADRLDGGSGDDMLLGGTDNDILDGGAGDDTLLGGPGQDLIEGGAGDDLLEGGPGADTLDGGSGADTVNYATSGSGVTIDLSKNEASGGDAEGDLLTGIESVIGSDHADRLTGDSGKNILRGGAGDDVLDGEKGHDTLNGGAGNDTAYGGAGNDVLLFGPGGGHDLFFGDAGLDEIALDVAGGPGEGSWTLALTSGSIHSSSSDEIRFSSDAAGTLTLEDGSMLTFEGIERIRW